MQLYQQPSGNLAKGNNQSCPPKPVYQFFPSNLASEAMTRCNMQHNFWEVWMGVLVLGQAAQPIGHMT
jgi:hypothetical protein